MKFNRSIIALLAILPIICNADEIVFSNFIKYSGKVGANGMPSGKGKLELQYKPENSTLKKDILEGVFNNGTVTDAKLTINKDWPLKAGSFKGTIEYAITPDGKTITYKMISGKFSDNVFNKVDIIPSHPFIIERTPNEKGCYTTASPIVTNIITPITHSDLADLMYPFKPSELGLSNESKFEQAEYLNFNIDEKKLSTVGNAFFVTFQNGETFNKFNDFINVEYPNGDYFTYKISNKEILSFKKTFEDATIDYDTKETTITYPDNTTYKGTVSFSSSSPSDIINTAMSERLFSESNIHLNNGTIMKDGQIIPITNGLSPEEIKRAQEEKEIARQKKIEEELAQKEVKEAKIKEQRKTLGVSDDEMGDKFLSVYEKSEGGNILATCVLGYFYYNGIGVKKDAVKAINYYKKGLSEAERRADSGRNDNHDALYYGKIFMADAFWEGQGVQMDRKKALSYYVDCLAHYSDPIELDNKYAIYYFTEKGFGWYRIAQAYDEGKYGTLKDVDNAINAYKMCIESGITDDNLYAYAKYRLGYYIEKGRYRAINGRYGPQPNIQKAREYYREAYNFGDSKTKNLAKQALNRLGN